MYKRYTGSRHVCLLCLESPAGFGRGITCSCIRGQIGHDYFVLTDVYVIPRFLHEINVIFPLLKMLYKKDDESIKDEWWSLEGY